MENVTELTTRRPLEEGPAALGRVTAALADANAKVLAMMAAASSAGRIMNIRMLVDDPAHATEALDRAGIFASPHDALSVKMDDLESLTSVTRRLGRAGVRVDSAYFAGTGSDAVAVFSVSNVNAANDSLK